ncbi:MAG: hypothetical protein KBA02_00245 [Paludibacteraceae bacterium]|nr:hypothetical protein [Paludibacteraceae bacterium]
MQIKLQKKLFNKYPKLFSMCWGINCGDGWYSILDALCTCIETIQYSDKPDVSFVQIKEKYGTLRVYESGADVLTEGMVHMAEVMSAYVCEVCGSTKDVTTEDDGWITTRCKKCRSKEG